MEDEKSKWYQVLIAWIILGIIANIVMYYLYLNDLERDEFINSLSRIRNDQSLGYGEKTLLYIIMIFLPFIMILLYIFNR